MGNEDRIAAASVVGADREFNARPSGGGQQTSAFDKDTITRRVFVDITDLVFWLQDYVHVSGIQRVQVELVADMFGWNHDESEYLSAFRPNGSDEILEVPNALMRILISYLRSGHTTRGRLDILLRRVTLESTAASLVRDDVFFVLGAFWNLPGTARMLERLVSDGVVVGALIYDLIPVRYPEFCDASLTKVFSSSLIAISPYFSFAFAISDFVARDYGAFRDEHKFERIPIVSLPLAVQLAKGVRRSGATGDLLRRVGPSYVLQVGTVEIRKNPRFALQVWRELLASGVQDIPTLVYVGRVGWRIADFMGELEVTEFLGGRVMIISGASDIDLAELYAGARFTIFPSFTEGWGLPVGESLAHGVPCITSNAASLPEVGLEFVEYVDPLNIRSGVDAVRRLLDDEYRDARARQIREQFPLRSWSQVGEMFGRNLSDLIGSAKPPFMAPKPPVPSGRLIGMGYNDPMARRFKVWNWYDSEHWGFWGMREKAGFRFQAETTEKLRLFLGLRSPPFSSNQIFRIMDMDGQVLEKRTLDRTGARFMAVVDVQPDTDGWVAIEIEVIGPAVPRPTDHRLLYVGVESVGYAAASDLAQRQRLMEAILMDSSDVVGRTFSSSGPN